MDINGIAGTMGRLADGSAFFDRQQIMSRAWDLLKTSNLLLLAPRRVGKSSLLNRMREDGVARGYQTLYLSVPDAEDELDFIKRLVRGFRDAEWAPDCWLSAFKKVLPDDLELVLKTGLIELKTKMVDWRRPAEELEKLLKSGDERTVLLVDELPLLIGSIVKQDPTGNRAERFLLWLKRLREQFAPRWFFAGSIGLDTVARRLKLSGTIHDLQPIELGAFSPETARAYLMARGQYHGWALGADTVEAILTAVEWPIPFHLNLIFEEVRAVVGEGRGSPTPALVETALQRLMANGRTHFDHWDERLAKMLDSRVQKYCEIALSLACWETGGASVATIDLRLSLELSNDQERADMLRQVLDLLISDGYLVRQQGVVRFRSALLRRYWREVQP
jgi:GTPase SAR1 family protein